MRLPLGVRQFCLVQEICRPRFSLRAADGSGVRFRNRAHGQRRRASYDYEDYGKEILVYLDAAKNKAKEHFAEKTPDFTAAVEGARHLEQAGAKMAQKQRKLPAIPSG